MRNRKREEMEGKKRKATESRPDTAEKRNRSADTDPKPDLFDGLPDDLVLSVLCHVSSSAGSPSDLVSVLLTCKRMNGLGRSEVVLARASRGAMAISAGKWSESGNRFLKSCCDAGNLEACYVLGMIRFYCLESRAGGAALMARAALGSHAAALFSLAVIRFNGSGYTSKSAKDPWAGFALMARAAHIGHVDAIRELGHCLVDGHGTAKRPSLGRRFLIQAALHELLASDDTPKSVPCLRCIRTGEKIRSKTETDAAYVSSCPCRANNGHVSDMTRILQNLLKDAKASALSCPYRFVSDSYNSMIGQVHPVHRFLRDWFGPGKDDGLRMCSNGECGRRETRKHEFRRCAVCSKVNYCSRACQARDWRVGHKDTCRGVDAWGLADGAEATNHVGLM